MVSRAGLENAKKGAREATKSEVLQLVDFWYTQRVWDAYQDLLHYEFNVSKAELAELNQERSSIITGGLSRREQEELQSYISDELAFTHSLESSFSSKASYDDVAVPLSHISAKDFLALDLVRRAVLTVLWQRGPLSPMQAAAAVNEVGFKLGTLKELTPNYAKKLLRSMVMEGLLLKQRKGVYWVAVQLSDRGIAIPAQESSSYLLSPTNET